MEGFSVHNIVASQRRFSTVASGFLIKDDAIRGQHVKCSNQAQIDEGCIFSLICGRQTQYKTNNIMKNRLG
jgi:hypothetical protein